MATIMVAAGTFTFSGVKYGCSSVSFDAQTELVQARVDGVLYAAEPGVKVHRYTVRANFVYTDTLASFTNGDSQQLSFVGKEGKGGTDATFTFFKATVVSVELSSTGMGGTVTFEVYSTDGTTNPLSVT